MAQELQPILNGVAPSWAEVKITAQVSGGVSLPSLDWKSFSFESKVDQGFQRGPGGRVTRRTTGQKTDTASGTLYATGFDELVAGLAAIAPKDGAGRAQISKVSFDVVILHSFDDDTAVREVTLKGCRLVKDAVSNDDGSTDAATVDIDLNPLEIVRKVNGVEVVLL
jgi:hypothetical protein